MKDFILAKTPVWVQNCSISIFNRYQWWRRQRGAYLSWMNFCKASSISPKDEWEVKQKEMLKDFLKFAVENSPYYKDCDPSKGLSSFPILEKEILIKRFDDIRTIPLKQGVVSYTGGTTGASMKVVYSLSDVQKRFATLDWFRGLYGWELGKRTAWFSGKTIVRDADIQRGNCHRDDYLTKTRFFSTFHINEKNFDVYWKSLIEFDPEYIVGFPSSIAEILSIAEKRGLSYPGKVNTFFPTAETVLPRHRELLKNILGADTKDQYASSEGAPFIVESPSGHLHILPFTGVFEVVDENGLPAREGEILVTAFQTHGTPLIRYRVGDRIALADDAGDWSYPAVERIDGRTSDFIWSPTQGRINLGNLSNSTKGIPGIIAFRVLQDQVDLIDIEVLASDEFDGVASTFLESAIKKRTGDEMNIVIKRVDDLPRKASGKFRIVENSLRPEQMQMKSG